MSSDLEPVVIKRSVSHDEITPSESPVSPVLQLQLNRLLKRQKEKDPNALNVPSTLISSSNAINVPISNPSTWFAIRRIEQIDEWSLGKDEQRGKIKYENEAKVLLEAYNKEFKAYKEGTLAEPQDWSCG